MAARPRIAVLGGGFAGLESIYYLKYKLGDRADLTLVSDSPKFQFKPNTIYIPFGEPPEKFEVDLLPPLKKRAIGFVRARVDSIDPDRHSVATDEGRIDFDYLVVATGAKMRSEEIPGLHEHAITVWTPHDMLRLRERIERATQRAADQQRTRFVFVVPPNNKCSGPLYEIVLMLDTYLRRSKAREFVDLVFATKEQTYIEAFGPRLHEVVADEFRERNIEGHTQCALSGVEPERLLFQNGEQLSYDVLVSFPPYVASEAFAHLPTDERGFIQVDRDSRRVVGQERIFAAGDAADFPIKQAFLALLQGDAVGDHIAAEVLGEPPTVDFQPMSMCVMEELNKATFAQVPLRYTDNPDRPVSVDPDDPTHYKVGVSPLWRMGKTMLGFYLPWRFGQGKPFHAGFAWNAMDLGLKAMSKVLAT